MNLPKTSTGENTTPTQLAIVMTADGKVLLNGQAATDELISTKAKEEFIKNPEIQAIISADKDVPHGRVMTIIDLIKLAGVKKFAFSIDKKSAN